MARAVRAGAVSVLRKASALADGSKQTARPQQAACAQQAASTAEQLAAADQQLEARRQQELAGVD